jgi:hypothetical protein
MRFPFHRAFKLPNVHYWITKLCRREAEVVRSYVNAKYSQGSTMKNTQHNVQVTGTWRRSESQPFA